MSGRRNVLVVGDDGSDADFVRGLLGGSEFDVRVVARIENAQHATRDRRCDIVILDMSLPGATGVDAMRALEGAQGNVPVVILSRDGDEERARLAVRSGAQDYLMKNIVTQGALRRSLRYAIERHQMRTRIEAGVEELERQRASVLELNQLKNDLIATLAHDIKGPLTSITGFAELLEDGYLEGADAVDAARTIRSNAQRLATLANDVLALSRVEHGELEIADDRVNLREVLDDVAALHAPGAVSVDGPAQALVRGDAARLRQVFDNVVRNALKYGRGEAPVAVRLGTVDDCVTASVTDTGIGIPESDIPKLFERFSRASNARRAKISGTGLGLFIARTIVERHAGSIAVASAVDRGSTFTVTLPSYASASAYSQRRVAVVSTDAGLARFVAYELRSRGFRVREYAGAAGLTHIDEMRPNDIVLLDARCSSPEDIRPLVPTGTRLVGIAPPAGASGYDAVLPRPFLLADLLATVEA